jgi:hypothetical protein
MAECLVNREPIFVNSGLKTWGELLGCIDRVCDTTHQAVTVVRFDGVDQPSFRAEELGERELAPIHRVEIETADRGWLLRGTLASAYDSLPELAAAAARAAESFRLGQLHCGREQLSALVAALRTLTELTLASAMAAGADLERTLCGRATGAEILGGVSGVIDDLTRAQQNGDWVAVADALEFDLPPAILGWGSVFNTMQERCAA